MSASQTVMYEKCKVEVVFGWEEMLETWFEVSKT
jgi:hypothetical protein